MLIEDELDRIVVVLVRARNPNNIGAAARAMHDFGVKHLRIVNEFDVPFEGARSAVDAAAVLHAAGTYSSVKQAIADCTLILGTTAVGARDLDHRLLALRDAAPVVRSEVCSPGKSGRVALLFGSEKTGLSNLELSHCNWLLNIPMNQLSEGRHLSMNLGQAVAVCLYELVRDRASHHESNAAPAAEAGELERLAVLLAEVLDASDYTRRHPANSGEADLRRLTLRMGVNRLDAPVWMGILRQILWKLRC